MVGDLAADDPGLGEHLCEGHLSQAPPPKAPVGSPEPVEPWSDEEEDGTAFNDGKLNSPGKDRPAPLEIVAATSDAVFLRRAAVAGVAFRDAAGD
jgi:hypothetical protein